MSTVNFSEVLAKVAERGGDPEQVNGDLAPQLDLMPFTAVQALAAAQLRPLTRYLGLSLGDRACLGLELGATVLTADSAWASLPAPHRIEVVR